jgi:sodium transport system permease protein
MNSLVTVMRKELVEIVRDSKAMSLALGSVVFLALSIAASVAFGSQLTQEEARKTLTVAVEGAEYAPNLVAWLNQQGVEIVPAPADAEQAVRNQSHEVVLRIGADYASQWRSGMPALVEVVSDSSRMKMGSRRLDGLLQQYNATMGALRLAARGIQSTVAIPLGVARRDVSTPASRMALFLLSFPLLLLIAAIFLGSPLAIDATAGERERQSLEPLLATPTSRKALMGGKLAAVVIFGLSLELLMLVVTKIAFALIPSSLSEMTLSWTAVLKLFAIVSAVVVLGGALVTLLAANSKTTKEANTSFQLMLFVLMAPMLKVTTR